MAITETVLAFCCAGLAAAALMLFLLQRRTARQLAARLAQLEREHAAQARQFDVNLRETDSFAHSVSHDLRAPLRVIDGFADILVEDYGPRLDTLGRSHLQRIKAAAARMSAMIDALLALSRRTARAPQLEDCDLGRMAQDLAEELRAGEPGRAVEFRIQADAHACGDPILLRLVLQNLLGNAFKFSARTPRAVIEFGRCTRDGMDAFFVSDNGTGFDMRYADRLFGLFQRFHPQDEYPGTGVGLATVQRIVQRHGGRIWAQSEPGCGASFYFTLAAPARSTEAAGLVNAESN